MLIQQAKNGPILDKQKLSLDVDDSETEDSKVPGNEKSKDQDVEFYMATTTSPLGKQR